MFNKRYLKLYTEGEYSTVWKELVSLGSATRNSYVYQEAILVCQELMHRAKSNCDAIVARLKSIEYQFETSYTKPRTEPDSSTLKHLADFEQSVGLPLSLRKWYEIVGGICLMGSWFNWNTYLDDSIQVRRSHLGIPTHILYVDPLVVSSSEDTLMEQGYDIEDDMTLYKPTYLSIAPDYYHKVGVSGGGTINFLVPDHSIDALVKDEKREQFFVDHLKTAFQWGGFPGFADVPEELRPTEMLNYLREGLLPI